MEAHELTEEEAMEISQMVFLYLVYKSRGHFEIPLPVVVDWVQTKNPQASFISRDGVLYVDVTSTEIE